MERGRRVELRAALLDAAPWLGATDLGPQSVTAGSCDRCRTAPRLVTTCGPSGYTALCRECLLDEGDDAWCDGHRDEGNDARTWAGGLPMQWADAVVLWWVSTGEVRLADWTSSPAVDLGGPLGDAVRAALAAPR